MRSYKHCTRQLPDQYATKYMDKSHNYSMSSFLFSAHLSAVQNEKVKLYLKNSHEVVEECVVILNKISLYVSPL